jgi:hypothetical protein
MVPGLPDRPTLLILRLVDPCQAYVQWQGRPMDAGVHSKPADAETGFRQVLDARLRVLGPEHPNAWTTASRLKRLYRDKDQ